MDYEPISARLLQGPGFPKPGLPEHGPSDRGIRVDGFLGPGFHGPGFRKPGRGPPCGGPGPEDGAGPARRAGVASAEPDGGGAEPDEPEAGRRAAIVSVDIVGYSTRICEDLAGTVRAVRACNDRLMTPEIRSRGGSLVSRAGDSWLVEFAAVPDAVRFALAVQDRAGPILGMPLRIGLHVGDVAPDGGTLHGSGINIAVRLQGLARPGGVTFSADVHEELPDDLPRAVREIGPRIVKNIPDPVWVYRFVMPGDEDESAGEARPAVDLAREVPGLSRRPALAVLPFRNAKGDADHDYFSEGLTDDVINGLSRVRWLPVIARNSTFQFKHADVDVREVGRRLGARYVVSGSVLATPERLQVQVRLTEAEEGRLVWSERYDREPHDLFAVRDGIARGIVAAVEPEFSRAEQVRSRTRPLESLDDWELVRRGVWHMNRLTRQDLEVAAELFQRALVRNPSSVEALVHLAWWHFWDVWVRRGPTEGWVEMARLSRRAMSLDRQDARPLMLTGIAEFMQGETARGRRLLERAIAINPSLAVAHASIGSTHILAGEPELAVEPLQTALRLSPDDFYIFHTLGELATARYMMGDYNLGLRAAEEALRVRFGYIHAHVVRIGCLARAGRILEAGEALRDLTSRHPGFSLADVAWLPFADRHWIDHLAEGLRLAGFRPGRRDA